MRPLLLAVALSCPAAAAVLGSASLSPVAGAPVPVALDAHFSALDALPLTPAWGLAAASYLQASLTASGPSGAPAVHLVAEALARPELFSALHGTEGLEKKVAAVHADARAKDGLLKSLAPLRAPADDWAAAFDGTAPAYPPLATNFPGMLYAYGDPAAIKSRGTYYVAATSNNAPDAGPLVKSKDLKTWEPHGFLFPRDRRPAWHQQDAAAYDFWAPEVHKVGRRFVAYYTARDTTGELRIGAAWAKTMDGPWTDLGRPLIADERVGLIDSHHFRDPKTGKHYLYWKKDGNGLTPKEKTTFYVRELTKDGLGFAGERREVLENDQEWEGDVVEGAWVVFRDGWYYMLYSGNDYTTGRYALGVARSRSPLGPFEKNPRRLLSTGALAVGPGHCSVVKGPRGEDLLVYHSYEPSRHGYRTDRVMRIEKIEWVGGWPRVGNGFPGGVPPRP